MHGKTSRIHHDGRAVFSGIADPFIATRYHSLVVDPELAPVLELIAWTRRRRRHGDPASRRAGRGRPVPPRIDPDRPRTRTARQLPRLAGLMPSPRPLARDRPTPGWPRLGRAGASEALSLVMSGEAGEIQTAGFLVACARRGDRRGTRGPRRGPARTPGAGRRTARTVRRHLRHRRRHLDVQYLDGRRVRGGRGRGCGRQARQSVQHQQERQRRRARGPRGRIDLSPEAVALCLAETGVGFMFAPAHHPAFAHVVPVRRALAIRTVFNLLGPMANPAGATHQVIGSPTGPQWNAWQRRWRSRGPTARWSCGVGTAWMSSRRRRSPTPTRWTAARSATSRSTRPNAASLRPEVDVLAGGEPSDNARQIREILAGAPGPGHDVVVLNAGAAIWISGAAADLADGIAHAEAASRPGPRSSTWPPFARPPSAWPRGRA